ncbi:antitermination protein Q, partial [Atlantibacter hermannii]|uniref:antitermination protein Q n=1 Tax=Atlantibacter hermannii TaxID=565 RepID=UPI00296E4107
FGFAENTDDLFVGKTLLHGDVLMWLMKTLLTSGCTNQRGAGHSDFEVKREVTDTDHHLCEKCHGTGKISKRCQCGGTGKTLDRKNSELQGVPVYKECKRCEGRGYSRPKSSVAYRGILSELDSLPDRTWRYSWKPFYESLVTKCFEEESNADAQLKKVTRTQDMI